MVLLLGKCMLMKNCKNCYYWDISNGEVIESGYCHLNPPFVISGGYYEHVMTMNQDWCGQWKCETGENKQANIKEPEFNCMCVGAYCAKSLLHFLKWEYRKEVTKEDD